MGRPSQQPRPGRGAPGRGEGEGKAPLHYAWPTPLLPGRLVRRYERFIAEVHLDTGERVRAHCVNPGRMEGMVLPGARVWLSLSPNSSRALRHTWELVELDGVLVGANTSLPNTLVRHVLEARVLTGFADVLTVRPEQRFGRGHRVDFLLSRPGGDHYVEVKNCHLVYPDGVGYFPDSVSDRAEAHVDALGRLVKRGLRATVLFTVQRADAQALRPSDLHSPGFAKAVRRAARAGVEFRALRFVPSLDGLTLDGEVPVDVAPYSLEPVRGYARALEATSGWERKDGRWAGRSLG